MKAAVLESLNVMNVRDVPVPEIGPYDALMRVDAVSICGSDLRIFRHGNPRVVPPTVIGHEVAGTVVAVGDEVTRVRVGERIALGADVPCGQCDWCRNGLGNNCAINYAIGYQIPGAFAEYMRLPRLVLEEGPVTPIGPDLPAEEAALAEPLACAINGFELARLALGHRVLVMGMGAIGCMMIDLARVMGARQVIATQRSAGRMAIARAYGADAYLASEETDVEAAVRDLTEGHGPDVIITACASVEAHEQAVRMVAHRGIVNLFGGLPKDTRPMSVPSNLIHYKECFVTGSHGSTPRQHQMAVDLIRRGAVRVKPLITHRFPLTSINEAFAAAESRAGMKIVIQPHANEFR